MPGLSLYIVCVIVHTPKTTEIHCVQQCLPHAALYSPGGFVKEHDRRVVHKLEGDGQALALTPRQIYSARTFHFGQAECIKNIIHLQPVK